MIFNKALIFLLLHLLAILSGAKDDKLLSNKNKEVVSDITASLTLAEDGYAILDELSEDPLEPIDTIINTITEKSDEEQEDILEDFNDESDEEEAEDPVDDYEEPMSLEEGLYGEAEVANAEEEPQTEGTNTESTGQEDKIDENTVVPDSAETDEDDENLEVSAELAAAMESAMKSVISAVEEAQNTEKEEPSEETDDTEIDYIQTDNIESDNIDEPLVESTVFSTTVEKFSLDNNTIEKVGNTSNGPEINNNNNNEDPYEEVSTLKNEIKSLQEELKETRKQLSIAQKNATAYEIQTRKAKNEEGVAKLKKDYCLLQLESDRNECQVTVDEWKEKYNILLTNSGVDVNEQVCSNVQCKNMEMKFDLSTFLSSFLPSSTGEKPQKKETKNHLFDSKPPPYTFKPDDSDTKKPTSQDSSDLISNVKPYIEGGKKTFDSAFLSFQQIASTHILPNAQYLVILQFSLVLSGFQYVYQVSSIMWVDYLNPFYSKVILNNLVIVYETQLKPLYEVTVLPWYKTNAQAHVEKGWGSIVSFYEVNLQAICNEYVFPTWDIIVDKFTYVAYFTIKFLDSEDLPEKTAELLGNLGVFMLELLPNLITILSRQPQVISIFGENSEFVSSAMVYGSSLWVLYYLRRIILGLLALVLIVILSPILIIVFLMAKGIALLQGKKKPTKKTPKSSSKNLTSGSIGSGKSSTLSTPTAFTQSTHKSSIQHTRPMSSPSGAPYKSPTPVTPPPVSPYGTQGNKPYSVSQQPPTPWNQSQSRSPVPYPSGGPPTMGYSASSPAGTPFVPHARTDLDFA